MGGLPTHPKVFSSPLSWTDAITFLGAFWQADNIAVLSAGSEHWTTLVSLLGGIRRPSGNLFFDIRTYALMREHGLSRIYTADTDFKRFPLIDVINPLQL